MSAFLPSSAPSGPGSTDEPPPPENPLQWAFAHRRIDGRPFDLARYRPLEALYEDDHPDICVMKPAQRGLSEWAINYALFALDRGHDAWRTGKNGLNVAYFFPTDTALRDFSKERVSGLMEESPHLREMFDGEFDSLGFKKIGNSYLYLRGTSSTAGLRSFPCDVLVLDEFDEMLPSAVALALRRLNASVVKRQVRLSTPTIPGKGIHALYARSDRRQYEQPCPRCGAWVAYDFHRDVTVDGVHYEGTKESPGWKEWDPPALALATPALTCPQCRGEVSDVGRCAEGRWVAREPGIKGLRGYHIPTLAFPMADLARLVQSAVSTDPSEQTEFWRSDLGIPFDASGSRVTEALLAALDHRLAGGLAPEHGPWLDATMGVDVGARFHFRVSATHLPTGLRIVRQMGHAATWGELTNLMTRYQVRRCVVDAQPELHGCRDWAKGFPGRVYRATYPQADVVSAKLYHFDEADGAVKINRTMAMDAVYGGIAGGGEHWPSAFCRDREIVAHLTAPVRVVVKDDQGQDRVSWVHTSPDHGYHACFAAGTWIDTEQGPVAIEDVRPGTRVWTRDGLKPVLAAGVTRPDAAIARWEFSNGATLLATPDHPICTANRGFVPLHAIGYDDTLISWQTWRKSPTTASLSGATPTAAGDPIASITRRAATIAARALAGCIRKSTRTISGRSRRAITSITRTKTPSITTPPISNCCSGGHTSRCTKKATHPAKSTWIAFARWRASGATPPKGRPGTASTPKRCSPLSRIANIPARILAAASRFAPVPTRAAVAAIAPRRARRLTVAIVAWTTLIASARSAAGRSASTAIAKPRHALSSAASDGCVRLSSASPAGRAPVYNLTVSETPEYFANGLLVHNCGYDRVAYISLREQAEALPLGVLAQGTAKGWMG